MIFVTETHCLLPSTWGLGLQILNLFRCALSFTVLISVCIPRLVTEFYLYFVNNSLEERVTVGAGAKHEKRCNCHFLTPELLV
jgi:hypothetical protein